MSSAFEIELWDARLPQSLAQLARAGITRDMTRGPAWRRTSRGWFVPADTPASPTQRIVEAVPRIPGGGALAGWAAAYVLGVDQLDGLDRDTMDPMPVPLHLGHDVGRAAYAGVRVVRERLPATDRRLWHGLPVTTPLRTVFDGGRWAPDLVEAVVFLDLAAHALSWTCGTWTPGASRACAGRASRSCGLRSGWPTLAARARGSLDCGCSTSSRLSCRDPW